MKIAIAWLLPLLVFPSPVLGQDPDYNLLRVKMTAQRETVTKIGEVFAASSNPCGDSKHISREFREVAGDAFDEVLSLETAELKGQSYFEPILHEAELAAAKAKRKANNKDEDALAGCLNTLKQYAQIYRGSTKAWNDDKDLFQISHAEKHRKWIEEDEKFLRAIEGFQKNQGDVIRELLKQRA
jgi:hypothetical protein